jgi:Spy/CpxP family protein refolding chaperone
MDDSKKIGILTTLVVVLVVLNIALLTFMWMAPHGGDRMGPAKGPAGLVVRELKLDDSQKKQFEVLRDDHRSAMRKINDQERELHINLFADFESAPDSVRMDSITTEIARLQKQREMVTYRHLNMVRQICKPDQQKLFDEMLRNPDHGRPDGPPPPRD